MSFRFGVLVTIATIGLTFSASQGLDYGNAEVGSPALDSSMSFGPIATLPQAQAETKAVQVARRGGLRVRVRVRLFGR